MNRRSKSIVKKNTTKKNKTKNQISNPQKVKFKVPEKIVWLRDQKDFAYLINKLEKLNYIKFRSSKFELINLHFSHNGNKFTTLQQEVQNLKNYKKESQDIQDILKDFVKEV